MLQLVRRIKLVNMRMIKLEGMIALVKMMKLVKVMNPVKQMKIIIGENDDIGDDVKTGKQAGGELRRAKSS